MTLKPVKYVIFDMDGLLLDTETVYKNIFQEICRFHGKDYTDNIRTKVLGTVPNDSAKIIIDELNLPLTVQEFRSKVSEKLLSGMKDTPFMPGAVNLVCHLVKNEIPIAIATSSEQDLFDIKMEGKKEFLKYFHHVVLGSSDPEVKKGKPAPDIYIVCASRFPADPSECLVFEDAPNGMKAALGAGMQCVLVPESIIPEEQRKPASLVLNSLSEFKPELFGLPAIKA